MLTNTLTFNVTVLYRDSTQESEMYETRKVVLTVDVEVLSHKIVVHLKASGQRECITRNAIFLIALEVICS